MTTKRSIVAASAMNGVLEVSSAGSATCAAGSAAPPQAALVAAGSAADGCADSRLSSKGSITSQSVTDAERSCALGGRRERAVGRDRGSPLAAPPKANAVFAAADAAADAAAVAHAQRRREPRGEARVDVAGRGVVGVVGFVSVFLVVVVERGPEVLRHLGERADHFEGHRLGHVVTVRDARRRIAPR